MIDLSYRYLCQSRADFKPLPVAPQPRQVSRARAGRLAAFALEPLGGCFRHRLLLKPCDVVRSFRGCHFTRGFSAMYFPNPPKPVIYLLKIHGALDMFTITEGSDLLKLLPNVST